MSLRDSATPEASATFAERLRAGENLVGLLVKMPAIVVIEIAGELGYDFVVIDTEHGARDSALLESHIRAADSASIPALVRVPRYNRHEILFALDADAAGLIVPRVIAAEDVDEVVAAAYYPPVGERGLALTTRAGRHGLRDVRSHIEAAQRQTVLIVQIEDALAVGNAHAIAAHPQVDAVFIGPNDLSCSMGCPGETTHPEVAAAIAGISDAVRQAGGTALCMLASDAAEALAWREQGATVTVMTVEMLLSRHLARLRSELNSGLDDEQELSGKESHVA